MNRQLKAEIVLLFGRQADFSRLLGISEDRLSKIIHGRLAPRATEKKTIAAKLNCNEAEIFPTN
jgi:DNA-binding transcriptional regulator YdaS (Cro superfamily)